MSQISVPPDAPDNATVEITNWCFYIYHEKMGRDPDTKFKVIVDALRRIAKIQDTSLDIKGVYRVCFNAEVPYDSVRWFGNAVKSALDVGAKEYRSYPGTIYIHYFANNKEVDKAWFVSGQADIVLAMEELNHTISQHLGKSLHPAQQYAPQPRSQPQAPAQTSTDERFKVFKRKKPADTTQQQTETRPAPYSGDNYPMYGEEDDPDNATVEIDKWCYYFYRNWFNGDPATNFNNIVSKLQNFVQIQNVNLSPEGVYRVCFSAVVPYIKLRQFGAIVISALSDDAHDWKSYPGAIFIYYFANNKQINTDPVRYITDKSTITSAMDELYYNLKQRLEKKPQPSQQRTPQQQSQQSQQTQQTQPRTQAPTQARPPQTQTQPQSTSQPSSDDYPMYGEEDPFDKSYPAMVPVLQKMMSELDGTEQLLNRVEELITDPYKLIPVQDLVRLIRTIKEVYNGVVNTQSLANVNYIQAIVAANPNLDPTTHEVFVNYIESVRAFIDRAEAVMQELNDKIRSSRSEQVKKKVSRI